MKKIVPLSVMLALASPMVMAHEEGDFFMRGGLASVMPNESSDNVLNTGELELTNDMQVGLTFTYMMTDNVGIELLAATPFTHDVSTNGLGKIAEVSHLPPTLMGQYYFGEADSKYRPYLGAGLNYTTFFEEKGFGALNNTEVELDDSFGLAVQAGIDVEVNEDWFFNASLWYMDIDTEVKTTVGTFDAEIDPYVVMIGMGYTF
ncbi:membrane protein [Marinomonas sp. SBI22]|uniref:OmpW family outer membrane protein n=1 Tax=unclassified Marinomonas TaxID=196814 RepID=UPI0005FA6C74|nr:MULTISPECIES: OmpW family outer membrane protein [unclassified Marinomonas]KJZ14293.1 membrane protein [Marinomonas sp. S3726]KZM44140.1 membrane protein [Marinomonas sp. SBI22]KZM45299.1 membrane protein [Marinomonas sp. SBI8L]